MSDLPKSQDWNEQYRSKAPKLPNEDEIDEDLTEELLAFKVQRVPMKVCQNHLVAILKIV